LTLAYDGTDYYGWQTQKGKRTVQRVVEEALRKTLGEKIKVIASGRTDAGVHALAQVVNFKTSSRMSNVSIYNALNFWLPEDIACLDVEEVEEKFHARFWARSKTYRYLIVNSRSKPLFFNNYAHFLSYNLNTDLMRRELRSLLGRYDFRAFCASSRLTRDTIRTIKRINLKVSTGGSIFNLLRLSSFRLIAIEIEADGFLYHMVRNIVGTLIEIGKGRFKRGSMRRILAKGERKMAGPTAPAKGLYLVKVRY